jgi:predicted nucleic acid-binding Zn ribbon protein
MAVPTTPATPAPAVQTHGCVRCGKPVPLDVAMCENCNPLGLSQPASTQVHGTVFLAVGLAIVVMAVLARLAVSGIGPFSATVGDVVPSGTGLTITLMVTNSGTKTGSTTCQISRSGSGAGGAIVQSPHIDPGQTVTFRTTTERFGSKPLPLAVACDTP